MHHSVNRTAVTGQRLPPRSVALPIWHVLRTPVCECRDNLRQRRQGVVDRRELTHTAADAADSSTAG
jgi:uncharacterized protein YcfJ